MKKPAFCICENKGPDQLHGHRAAGQRPCFRYIVQSLYLLHPKFQASSHLLWLYSPVCVRPGWKPQRQIFSYSKEVFYFRNGHLMTHRDKKPYQCTVPGCTKSYCDARSLRRHLENHHQHTVEQIAIEMVKAQSMAAEVLADVAASTGMAPQTSSATNPKSSTEPNSAKSETVTGSKPSLNIPVTVTNTLVTKTQYVPVPVVSSAIVTSNTVVSPQPPTQAPQSHIFPYDIIVQQQQNLQKEHQQQVKTHLYFL